MPHNKKPLLKLNLFDAFFIILHKLLSKWIHFLWLLSFMKRWQKKQFHYYWIVFVGIIGIHSDNVKLHTDENDGKTAHQETSAGLKETKTKLLFAVVVFFIRFFWLVFRSSLIFVGGFFFTFCHAFFIWCNRVWKRTRLVQQQAKKIYRWEMNEEEKETRPRRQRAPRTRREKTSTRRKQQK